MEYRHPDARILIFAKAPRRGRVKTRLAASLGSERARRLYTRMAAGTVAAAARRPLAPVTLYCAPDPGHPFFMACRRRHGVRLRRQPPGDLGMRMHRALSRALRDARYAVLVGTDCPALDADYLERALDALAAGRELVLGPSGDGGYVLVGLSRPVAGLFRTMPWSTPRVLPLTRRRAARMGLDTRELAPLRDVDEAVDARRARRAGWL